MGAHEFLFLLANSVHTKKSMSICLLIGNAWNFWVGPYGGVLFIHAMVITLPRIKKTSFILLWQQNMSPPQSNPSRNQRLLVNPHPLSFICRFIPFQENCSHSLRFITITRGCVLSHKIL
jgi:hypothetical protein